MSTPNSLQIGDIRIDRIVEIELPFMEPREAFLDATADAVETHRHWLEPTALCPETGKLILAIQTYLVRTLRHTILIDTCVGCNKSNEWFTPWHQRTDTSWLAKLRAAGVHPEQVDYVFCTHLHGDHCGWNTRLVDGRWVPTFANAKYVLARDELTQMESNPNETYRESVLPIVEAGQVVLVDTDYALNDELWLEPAVGHTPGHVAVGFSSRGHQAVMCGDLIHSPLQCVYPQWRYWADYDSEVAITTRRRFLEASCESNRLVLTAHFPSPSVGHVIEQGSAFGFNFFREE